MMLDPSLTPHIKMDSKCIRGLNVRARTIHLIGGKVGVNHWHLGLGNDSPDLKPKVPTMKDMN